MGKNKENNSSQQQQQQMGSLNQTSSMPGHPAAGLLGSPLPASSARDLLCSDHFLGAHFQLPKHGLSHHVKRLGHGHNSNHSPYIRKFLADDRVVVSK